MLGFWTFSNSFGRNQVKKYRQTVYIIREELDLTDMWVRIASSKVKRRLDGAVIVIFGFDRRVNDNYKIQTVKLATYDYYEFIAPTIRMPSRARQMSSKHMIWQWKYGRCHKEQETFRRGPIIAVDDWIFGNR
jgi:hypothetical protein